MYKVKSITKSKESIFDKIALSTDDAIELTLTTDLENLIINKNNSDYQVAFLEMTDYKNEKVKHKLNN